MRRGPLARGWALCAVVLSLGLPAAGALELGTHVHDIGDGAPLPPATFTTLRLWDARVTWPDLEPQRGAWRFERLERVLARAGAERRELLLPLGLTPGWASSRPDEASAYRPGQAAPPARLADWEAYVRTVAQRLRGRVRHYELWNEPNLARFFSGSVGQLVELACSARRVLREVDPAARLVSPSATTQQAGVAWLEQFLAAGGARCVDIVGFHFYTLAHEPPEAALPLIRAVRAVMRRHGLAEVPLWDTEFGWYIANREVPVPVRWRVLDPDTAGAYLARALVLRAGEGLERAYVYAWNNRHMGEVEPGSGHAKVFVPVFSTVMGWLDGARVEPCVERSGLWRCGLRGADGQAREVVWATRADAATEVARLWRERGLARSAPAVEGPSAPMAERESAYPVLLDRR